MSKHYIVYCYTRYQDYSEEHTAMFNDMASAVAYIQKGVDDDRFNSQYNLFELGPEIPLQFDKEVVQPPSPPPVKKTVVKVKDKE